jgi:tRNA 5-methylaminomethyl-2-thiouridine biosynthesis bifunctional protein
LKTAPIRPARIGFDAEPGTAPQALDFDEAYASAEDGLIRARRVFLNGAALPAGWAGRAHFVVLEAGFGLGHNFLATWQAWRADPARCKHLFYVAIEGHPPTAADLERVHARSPLPGLAAELIAAWPVLTPNLHALDFDGGAVQLLLGLGDVALLLPALQLQADAVYLDGFAPQRNPQMWQPRVLKALGRKAAAGAHLASWCTAPELHAGLTSAGFTVQSAGHAGSPGRFTAARWAPHYTPRSLAPPRAAQGHPPQTAVVVGAGLAGAAAAQALARLGLQVTVLDRRPAPALEASGNPAGLFHGTINTDDGRHARLFRAAALQAARSYRDAIDQDPQMGALNGLLRLHLNGGGQQAQQAMLDRLGMPADWVQALGADAASARAGAALPAPAWFYPGGGWLDPARWVRHVLAHDRVRFQGGAEVAGITFDEGMWTVSGAAGRPLARAPVLVLACTATAPRLLQPWCAEPWPLEATRGQITHGSGGDGCTPLRCAVAGDGYALPLPDGGLLCGATREAGTLAEMLAAPDLGACVSTAAHRHNLQRLQRLTGLQVAANPAALQGRSGWRLHADDRLPIAGALPLREPPPGQRRDQARLLPRVPGLFVLTALGARGLTLAPLLGRLVAAQATDTPWPLEQDLADAVDPARWRVRAARRGQAGA